MMMGALLFTAIVIAAFATLICYRLEKDNLAVVTSAQFFSAFIGTSLLSWFFSDAGSFYESLRACALMSLPLPVGFVILRFLIGPLGNRSPGAADISKTSAGDDQPSDPPRRTASR